jgi:putative ATP-dependent endonuclease of OLD family
VRLSRVVIRNLRALQSVDVTLTERTSLIIGENNTGKSCFIHALRLCLDVGLSSTFRMLLKEDVHNEIDQTQPFQVLIGVEFTGFEGNENEEALLHGTQIGDNKARLFYRFRPKRAARELLARGGLERPLTLDDFGWELFGGGNPVVDLTAIEWNTENADISASSVGLQYLQSYLVVFLPALRDVEADLQHSRRSSLMRLIEASNIGVAEQQTLVDAVRAANAQIEASPTIQAIAASIDTSLKEITGPAFSLDVELGLSSPTFQAIVRNLIVLLSNTSVRQFEPRRNGLGLNNILYIAILIEHFRKRAAGGKSAGELILVEEPEAHLHPQLQATLVAALRELPFQVIATTHSTQVTSKAPLSSFIMLTQRPGAASVAATPLTAPALTAGDRQDLDRYLDATKSNLLFARRVMLVEGAAELLLLPPLVKRLLGFDLEREGISVVAIHGVHFGPFTRLFSEGCLPKRCAIVADADLDADDLPEGDDPAENPNLAALEGPYVRAFVGATTFEREITLEANLSMLAATAADLGAPRVRQYLEVQDIMGGPVPEALKDRVLRTAKRFGKARFAQVASRHVDRAGALPTYITNAIAWLREI